MRSWSETGEPFGQAGGSIPQIDLKPQHEALQAEIEERVRAVFASGQFIGGPEVEGLEREFAALCGADYGVAVSSGTDALRFALMAVGAGEGGGEVITSPLTFIATTEAITQAGARVVFADIDPLRFTLDPRAVERASTPRTRAIVPVHLYGQPADMEPIVARARRHGAAVIEDACQAHGALHQGKPAGTLGDAGGFSFYPTKNLGGCGEGGLVTTGSADLAARVRRLRDHGQSGKYVHAEEGYNGRLDALQAAILRVKLKHLPAWNERRRALAARYLAGLEELERRGRLVLPREASGTLHVWHQFSIRIPDPTPGTAEARDRVRAALRERGIDAGVHYPVPLHLQPCYAAMRLGPGSFPEAERAAREVLSLPMYPELSDGQVDRVIASLHEVLTGSPATVRAPGSRFSVIVPTFNRADLVRETIESVLAQTHRDFEIIVVDDGSTDDTPGALAPYLDRIRYVRQANRGLAAARNRGIQEANGDFVAFLDSDDLYVPEFLARVLATFRANPGAGAVFVAEREFVNRGTPGGRIHSKRTAGLLFSPAGMVGRDTGVGAGRPPVIRRAWLHRLGGFNEEMRCAVDCEMWIRYSFEVPMVLLPEPLVRRRSHPGNLSRDKAADSEDWLRILGWLKRAHPEFVRDHPGVYRRTLGKHHLRLGAALLARGDDDRARLVRARRELLQAIGIYPFFLRAYVYLAWSLAVASSFGTWPRRKHRRAAGRGTR